jgi:creatinine amidohydrolase
MTSDLQAVQAELLLPHEVDAALAARSVAYLPMGSIEFHSAHLPIGLDGLTAHGVCARAAARSGGIVFPALFYGVGGGHTAYPWTIMASSDAPIHDLLQQSFNRLQDFGVKIAVLFTGHFSDEQLDLIDDISKDWNAARHPMRVLALSVNRAEAHVAPDHAGIFETSLLSAMWADRVQLHQLPPLAQVPANDPDGDVRGNHRHDPTHPLYGVFGPDPRTFDPGNAAQLLEQIIAWTIAQVDNALARIVQPSPGAPCHASNANSDTDHHQVDP